MKGLLGAGSSSERGRVVVAVMTVAVLAAAAGVVVVVNRSDEPSDAVAGDEAGPGTPLGDGLVVPDEAVLAGRVFPESVDEYPPDDEGWSAVLIATGHPFDVWDDLAGQVRELGPRLAGSAAACSWYMDQRGSAVGQPVAQPMALNGTGAPPGATAAECTARAVDIQTDADGRALDVTVDLWSDRNGAHVGVSVNRSQPQHDLGFVYYGLGPSAGEVQPPPSPGPASSTDRDAVPRPPRPAEELGPGQPFGNRVNCIEDGYGHLRVPPGARVTAVTGPGVVGRDYAAVLAVSDPQAALEHFARQLVPEPGEVPVPEPRREPLPDGGQVWTLSHSVAGGGGACSMRASPDGRAVLVLPTSD